MNDLNNGYNNGYYQIQQQPSAPAPKKKKTGKATAKVAGLLAGVVVFAGGAGFGGAYLANSIANYRSSVAAESSVSSPASSDNTSSEPHGTPTLNELQGGVSSINHGENNSSDIEYNSDGTYRYTRDLVNEVKDSIVYVENFVNYNGKPTSYGAGSGVIISTDGYIITNEHVITNGVKQEVKVNTTAADGTITSKTYEAKLIGCDVDTDLAVLKIDATNLKAAKLGDSDQLSLGDDIVVIGNPLSLTTDQMLNNSVTKGIVSGLKREISPTGKGLTSIQTTAAINSGNSGGALFNGYGEVVGIAEFTIVYNDSQDMCFGITINEAKNVIEDLISKGYVTGRPMLGIEYLNVTQSTAYYRNMTPGMYVTSIYQDYPVAKSGLVVGDTIVKVDGKSTVTNDISTILASKHPGDTVEVTVIRNDGIREKEVTFKVELGESKS